MLKDTPKRELRIFRSANRGSGDIVIYQIQITCFVYHDTILLPCCFIELIDLLLGLLYFMCLVADNLETTPSPFEYILEHIYSNCYDHHLMDMIIVVPLGSTLLLDAQSGTEILISTSNVSTEPLLVKMDIKDLMVCRKEVKVCCDFVQVIYMI